MAQKIFYTIPRFEQLNLPHGFFTRRGGVSKAPFDSLNMSISRGDPREDVLQNQNIAKNLLDPERKLVIANQTHGAVCAVAEASALPKDFDAWVTADPRFLIGVISADCGPILLSTDDGRAVGAIHSGWRGTLSGIIPETLKQLEKLSNRRVYAVVGPMIHKESYEVGSEVREAFCEKDKHLDVFFFPCVMPGKYTFDLQGMIVHQLESYGVSVEVLGHDTYRQASDYFSNRRSFHQGESRYGCQLSAIGCKA